MPLAEVVIIEVGSAIAKSLLQLWMKDIPIASDTSSSILEILKSYTTDKVAQWKGQHQFETIGVKIGESLLPLFEVEGARLEESSLKAVALAVADTFKGARISSKLLIERNLEPTKLKEHVLASNHSATNFFNEAEMMLYRRIIEESCEYIVDIASQLPTFTEHSFAELLRREDQLLDITNTTLQELLRMREQINPLVEAQRFELEYRRAVSRNMDVLQLFGTDVSTANRRHRLSIAYITLSVEERFPNLYNTGIGNVSEEKQDEAIGDMIISVDRKLAHSRRLLLRGLAGSGKTTLLQWIAVQSASRSFKEGLSGWNTTIPFYIRLRHCINSGLPAPESFPRLIAPAIADTMPKKWMHAVLESGEALVLIDGLDEVPATRREEVRVWLTELVETFPNARYIVTSRPHAVEDGWMNHEGFEDAELQPMSISDIQLFIEHWHKAVREELQEDTEKAELPLLAEHLKRAVKSSRSIRTMATSPLLCAMLCALNRDRRKQLPADRIELYEACTQLLIERRDKERHIELLDYPSLTYRQKRVLLEDLAYWLVKNGWSEVERQQVERRFTRKLTNMPNIASEVTGSDVCRYFIERTSIVREPAVGTIDFTHRTFQEFLAAHAAIDDEDMGLLIQNAHNDQWREVIILASGIAPKKVREYLLQELIKQGDKVKKNRYQLHLLAVSCLSSFVELGQDLRSEVEKRLSKLIPPKKMVDSRALALAGELAIPYLSKDKHYPDPINKICIRTLALINGDMALDALEEYAYNASPTLINELVRAWEHFDTETYAERILSKAFERVNKLRINGLSSLAGFQYFTSITALTLLDCEEIEDLTPLSALTKLTSLSLSICEEIEDLTPLSALTKLTSLSLSNCERIKHINALATLTCLTSLKLTFCRNVSDFKPLSKLRQLTSLDLTSCPRIHDLFPLTNLKQLTTLDLSFCEQISGLTPLASLTRLTSLNLTHCSKVEDLTPLASLTRLTSLNLTDCSRISDLSPLKSLAHLTSLDLSNCFRVYDLCPLVDLAHLTLLNLTNCPARNDLSPLANLSVGSIVRIDSFEEEDSLEKEQAEDEWGEDLEEEDSLEKEQAEDEWGEDLEEDEWEEKLKESE